MARIVMAGVEDEREIAWAIYEYARALDERAWNALDRVFVKDCVAQYGGDTSLAGREAIVAAIRVYLDRSGPTQHLISNVQVSADGESLRSRAYVRAIHRGASDDRKFTSYATYHGVWGRANEGWRAHHWTMKVLFNEGDPAILGAR